MIALRLFMTVEREGDSWWSGLKAEVRVEGGATRDIACCDKCVATMKCNSMDHVVCMLSGGGRQWARSGSRQHGLAPCSGWQALKQMPSGFTPGKSQLSLGS